MVLALLMPFLLAFCYRIRGMHHDSYGTTISRIISWGVPIGLIFMVIAHLHGLPIWLGLISGLMAYLGVVVGQGTFQDNVIEHYLKMALLTAARTGIIVLPFVFYSLQFIIPALFILPWAFLGCYLGYKMKNYLIILGRTYCTPGESSWEELYIGASYGVSFALLML